MRSPEENDSYTESHDSRRSVSALVGPAPTPQEIRVPRWERVASAACVGYTITLAAHQLGLGAMWKSIPFVTGSALRTVLDMAPDDEFLGWVNIGHAASDDHADARPDIDLAPIARRLGDDGLPVPYSAAS